MHTDVIYIVIAAGVFILVLIGLAILRKKKRNVSWLLNIALLLVVVSLFFENRIISYPMVAVGIILVVIDLIKKKKVRK